MEGSWRYSGAVRLGSARIKRIAAGWHQSGAARPGSAFTLLDPSIDCPRWRFGLGSMACPRCASGSDRCAVGALRRPRGADATFSLAALRARIGGSNRCSVARLGQKRPCTVERARKRDTPTASRCRPMTGKTAAVCFSSASRPLPLPPPPPSSSALVSFFRLGLARLPPIVSFVSRLSADILR